MPPSPFDRLILITNVLAEAGPRGRSALELAGIVGYNGTDDSKRDQLSRDIRSLRKAGLEITNAADLGAEGQWVLHPRDSRIRLAFSDDERAELTRAALLTDGSAQRRLLAQIQNPGVVNGPQTPPVAVATGQVDAGLDELLHAVVHNCVVRFHYSGKARTLDPYEVEHGQSGWWLRGLEREEGKVKTFTVSRMSKVKVDLPGTASPAPAGRQDSIDPLNWQEDPPVQADISCPTEHLQDVCDLLNISDPLLVAVAEAAEAADRTGRVRLRPTVTNRWLFLARILELGERVRLDGPEELRDELRARLEAML